MNITNFKHPTVRANVRKAIENVIVKRYSVDHIRNRFGHAYLAVRVYDGLVCIQDKQGRNVTNRVLLWVNQ